MDGHLKDVPIIIGLEVKKGSGTILRESYRLFQNRHRPLFQDINMISK